MKGVRAGESGRTTCRRPTRRWRPSRRSPNARRRDGGRSPTTATSRPPPGARRRDASALRLSGLDDAALTAVIRGFYAGANDADLAERLGVSTGQVVRARINRPPFRSADTDAPFGLSTLRDALSEGATATDTARTPRPGVDREPVRGRAPQAGRRPSERLLPGEFGSLLGIADGHDLAVASLTDRRTMDDVVDRAIPRIPWSRPNGVECPDPGQSGENEDTYALGA